MLKIPPTENPTSIFLQLVEMQNICSTTDTDGNILSINSNFTKYFGYSEKEILGKNHNVIKSGVHDAMTFKNMWETIKSGELWRGNICSRAKDGRLHWMDTVIFPVFGDDGNIASFHCIRTSINDKVKLKKLRASINQNQQFILSSISHNIRGPLCTIEGILNILKAQENLNPGEAEEVLNHITPTLAHLKNATEALTDFISALNYNR